ncbi:hypothetical protein LTR12_008889 [Friedmanniomyces endolithicus]|nr:hypothetical protein LTR74_004538 [Friedmanniomyces endolithicus]KAK1816743.1 hypothetical protein LTR12_008889 [Friedmanniomyces endolithicus]
MPFPASITNLTPNVRSSHHWYPNGTSIHLNPFFHYNLDSSRQSFLLRDRDYRVALDEYERTKRATEMFEDLAFAPRDEWAHNTGVVVLQEAGILMWKRLAVRASEMLAGGSGY